VAPGLALPYDNTPKRQHLQANTNIQTCTDAKTSVGAAVVQGSLSGPRPAGRKGVVPARAASNNSQCGKPISCKCLQQDWHGLRRGPRGGRLQHPPEPAAEERELSREEAERREVWSSTNQERRQASSRSPRGLGAGATKGPARRNGRGRNVFTRDNDLSKGGSGWDDAVVQQTRQQKQRGQCCAPML
jgi:hypothetical protein